MFNYDKSDSEGWTHETTIKVAGVEFQFMKNDPRNDPDAYVSGSAWVPTPGREVYLGVCARGEDRAINAMIEKISVVADTLEAVGHDAEGLRNMGWALRRLN